VFDADDSDFDFHRAAEQMSRRKLVILHARTDRESTSASGFDWLGQDERQRYRDYICKNAAIQFLKARTLIRHVLAHYLEVTPAEIKLSSIQHTKPIASLDNPRRPIPCFNISHSGNWVSAALHADLPVGLDIECSEAPDLDDLCKSKGLFNHSERDLLAACSDRNTKLELFYSFWRCKEAIMKATGKGFALSPCNIDLTSKNGMIRKIISAEGVAWELHQINTQLNLKLAVAIKHSSARI
jgi:4'-phosphopantetheinyl transferase